MLISDYHYIIVACYSLKHHQRIKIFLVLGARDRVQGRNFEVDRVVLNFTVMQIKFRYSQEGNFLVFSLMRNKNIKWHDSKHAFQCVFNECEKYSFKRKIACSTVLPITSIRISHSNISISLIYRPYTQSLDLIWKISTLPT